MDKCREGKTLCEIAQIMWSLCTAVTDFHSENLLYLDIKPENLFLYENHNGYRVGFFDFDSMLPDSKETREGSFRPLSDLWCPPEQKLWNASLGKTADIFAIGAVFYWLISGKEATEDWLRDVDERVQQDILGECPKLSGFANATETARKILLDTLSSEASERTNDIGGLVAMAKELHGNSAKPGVDIGGAIVDTLDNFNDRLRELYDVVKTLSIEKNTSVSPNGGDHVYQHSTGNNAVMVAIQKGGSINVNYGNKPYDDKQSKRDIIADGFANMSDCLEKQQYSQAIVFLNQVLLAVREQFPNNPGIVNTTKSRLSEIYEQIGDYKTALEISRGISK